MRSDAPISVWARVRRPTWMWYRGVLLSVVENVASVRQGGRRLYSVAGAGFLFLTCRVICSSQHARCPDHAMS